MATSEQIAKVKRDVPASLLDSLWPDSGTQDANIGSIIDDNNGNHFRSVAHIYDNLAAKVESRGGTIKIGRYQESFSDQAEGLRKTADLWRAKAGGGRPYAGGISVADMEAKENDPDRVKTVFRKGMDVPETD